MAILTFLGSIMIGLMLTGSFLLGRKSAEKEFNALLGVDEDGRKLLEERNKLMKQFRKEFKNLQDQNLSEEEFSKKASKLEEDLFRKAKELDR
jgi:hypothetical protein